MPDIFDLAVNVNSNVRKFFKLFAILGCYLVAVGSIYLTFIFPHDQTREENVTLAVQVNGPGFRPN